MGSVVMVTVAQSIWDYANSESGLERESFWLCMKSQLPLPDAVDALVGAIDAAWPAPMDHPADFCLSAAGTGPVLKVKDWEELAPVVEPLATQLERADLLECSLDLVWPHWARMQAARHAVALVECRFAVRATSGSGSKDAWIVDPADWHDVIDDLALWCLDLPAPDIQTYVVSGLFTSLAPAAQLTDLLGLNAQLAISAAPLTYDRVRLIVESGDAFRMAELSLRSAHASIVDGSASLAEFDWRKSLGAVRAMLIRPPDWVTQAIVKRGNHWGNVGETTLGNDWVPVPHEFSRNGSAQRGLEERYSLDAFGAMLLRAAVARRLPPSDDWRPTWAADFCLLEHRNLESWFGGPKPDPSTLESARTQLRGVLPPGLDAPTRRRWQPPKMPWNPE